MRLSLTLSLTAMVGLLLVAANRAPQTCTLSIALIDAETSKPIPGLLRIKDADGKILPLEGLLERNFGTREGEIAGNWSVLIKKTSLKVPARKLTIEAFSGLESELTSIPLDLTDSTAIDYSVPVRKFYRTAEHGFRSANTHLHLKSITREEVDRYLIEIPKADGLDIVFLSYLERANADRTYTSNKYTLEDLARLEKQSGTGFGNGEEHRHNRGGGGEGYGHVMLLNIQKLIQPVSIGPGIMKMGTDGIPIQRGIDTAHRDGATVVWCHNSWGLEDIANVITGRLDAQNIFDGGSRSSYKHSFYRYLNAGFRVPFSTGTDWFIYDFSRVYVESGKYVTPQEWLKALEAGQSYITNGPLLEFKVNNKSLGSTVDLAKAGQVSISGRAVGRVDFQKLQLVKNGKVIRETETRPSGGHHAAEMQFQLDVSEPCWLALRTPPPSFKGDPEFQTSTPPNEFGKQLFGHTSPIYVQLNGQGVFDSAVAQGMVDELREIQSKINEQSTFADAQERARVLDVYDDAIEEMTGRIKSQSTKK